MKLEIAKQKQLLMKKHLEQQKVTREHVFYIFAIFLEIVFF